MAEPRVRQVRRRIHGVFLLNKPLGISSNAALQKVRWLFRAEKAGHTGALDPLATGLLPVCLGEATKFSHFLLDADKRYTARIQLGRTTTTADREGETLAEFAIPVLDRALLEAVLAQFLGTIQQVPPMYSALKKDGRPLYELARQGIAVARPARPVQIHALSLLDWGTDWLAVDVHCSKGTYIRTLAEDLGQALGSGAHLASLHRTQTGPFVLDESLTIEHLEALSEPEREALLLPVYAPVASLPRQTLSRTEALAFAQGQSLWIPGLPTGAVLAFDDTGACLGLAEQGDDGRLQPKRVLVP